MIIISKIEMVVVTFSNLKDRYEISLSDFFKTSMIFYYIKPDEMEYIYKI